MNVNVRKLTEADRPAYEAFLLSAANWEQVAFFHTWEWGAFMAERALKLERVGVYDGDKLVAVGQCGLQRLKVGRFWYCPRGLLLDYTNDALVTEAYKAVAAYFRGRSGAAFWRADPNIVRGAAAEVALDRLKPRQAAVFTQAERVWLVDIPGETNALLPWLKEHGMRSNVPRYLRKAERAGVTVRASSESADLERLITMLNSLNVRKGGIGKQTDAYYRQQFARLAPAGYEKVFLAEKDGEVLASSLITIYGPEASYLHGASSDVQRELSAPHTLHVETMKYLQVHYPAVKRYNFWGIVGDKNRTPRHPRHGYSEFKRSFGGYKQRYIRSRDFVYKPMLWRLAWLLDLYRTWKYKND